MMRMSKWELEFELDKNRFTIKYNKPIAIGDSEEGDTQKKSVLRNDPSPKLPISGDTNNNDDKQNSTKLSKSVDPIK